MRDEDNDDKEGQESKTDEGGLFSDLGTSLRRVENDVERVSTEAYGDLEASVAKFLGSVDQLAAVPRKLKKEHQQSSSSGPPTAAVAAAADDTSLLSSCSTVIDDDGGESDVTIDHRTHCSSSSSSASCPPSDQDLSILAIRSLAASQSRELWTTTTGVIERVLQVVRTSLPQILDDVERHNDVRHRKQKEKHRKSLEAARLACRKEWQGRLAREERGWKASSSKAELEHRGELGAMQMRAEGAETSRRVLSSRLDVAEETIQRLEHEVASTKSELYRTKKERDETVLGLNDDVRDANERERQAQESLVDAKTKLRNAEARYEAKVQKLSNTRDELKETKQELRTRTKDLSSLRTKYREKEDECRIAQKRTNDLEASLQFVGRPSPTKGSNKREKEPDS